MITASAFILFLNKNALRNHTQLLSPSFVEDGEIRKFRVMKKCIEIK